MEPVHAACAPLHTLDTVQGQLGALGVRVYQSAGPQQGPSEVADDHHHRIRQPGPSENREDGFPCGTRRFAVVARPLPPLRTAVDGGPAVVGRVPPSRRQFGQVGLYGILVGARQRDSDEPRTLERELPHVLLPDDLVVLYLPHPTARYPPGLSILPPR